MSIVVIKVLNVNDNADYNNDCFHRMDKMRGDRLKELRERDGHTQESLADLLGRDIKQVWRWETEKVVPSSEVIIQLAGTFNVSADYLLGLSDDPQNLPMPDLSPLERRVVKMMREVPHDADRLMIFRVINEISVSLISRYIESLPRPPGHEHDT